MELSPIKRIPTFVPNSTYPQLLSRYSHPCLCFSQPRIRFSVPFASLSPSSSAQSHSYPVGKQNDQFRVFLDCPLVVGQTVPIPHTELDHLRARRIRNGASFVAFNTNGQTANAVLENGSAVIHSTSDQATPATDVSLIIGFPKSPSRVDFIVEKLTELGANSISFVSTSRSVATPSKTKLSRWNRLSIASSKQSMRADVPNISILDFDQVLTAVSNSQCPLLLTSGGSLPLSEIISDRVLGSTAILILVGPEGGFDDTEIRALKENGALGVGLGAQRLRVETAAITSTALVQHILLTSPPGVAPPNMFPR